MCVDALLLRLCNPQIEPTYWNARVETNRSDTLVMLRARNSNSSERIRPCLIYGVANHVESKATTVLSHRQCCSVVQSHIHHQCALDLY